MSCKVGKQQKLYYEYCEKVINSLKKICLLDSEEKKICIAKNNDTLRTIGSTLKKAVEVFGYFDDHSLIDCIYHESADPYWMDSCGCDKASEYLDHLVKVAEDIIKLGKRTEQKECVCCQDRVYFAPYSTKFLAMHGIQGVDPEIDRLKEHICPNCMGNDRDRVMVQFLKKLKLDKGNKPVNVLQIEPSKAIEHWIYAECPAVIYHSTDIHANVINLESKFQQIEAVPNETYDYIICSSLLQVNKISDTAVNDLTRILKPDGLYLFSMPEEFSIESSDQRQSPLDHAGFCLYQFEQDTLKDDIIKDHAVLHILTKTKKDLAEIISKKSADRYDNSMKPPLVSVLMSVYNHEKYVSKAVESVLNQTYKNIEFLAADDCSEDGSANEILKYEERIDEIHLFGENGFGRIPFLLSIARGKYVAILDSDDYWEIDKIEKQVTYMEAHPDCGACFTNVKLVNGDEEEINDLFFSKDNRSTAEWIHSLYYYGNSLVYSSAMIKKEPFIRVNNQASNFTTIPDYMMWVNLALEYDIHLIEKELLNYRWHGTNDSINTPERIKNQFFEENYFWLEIMKKMDNDLFKSSFRAELTDPNVCDTREILCEKGLILLRSPMKDYRLAGLYYLYGLLANPEIKKIMYEKYHLGRQDIYEILNRL